MNRIQFHRINWDVASAISMIVISLSFVLAAVWSHPIAYMVVYFSSGVGLICIAISMDKRQHQRKAIQRTTDRRPRTKQ